MKDYLRTATQIGLVLTLLVNIVPAPQDKNHNAPGNGSEEMPIEHAMADLERLHEMEMYDFGDFDKEEEKKNILSEAEWGKLRRVEQIGKKTIQLDQCICQDENKWRCPKGLKISLGYTCKKVGELNCENSFKQKRTLCTPNPTPCPKAEMGGPCMAGECHNKKDKQEMSDIRNGYIDAYTCIQGYCCLIKKAKHSKSATQKLQGEDYIRQTIDEWEEEEEKEHALRERRQKKKSKDWAEGHKYEEHPMVNF
ncbi:hypothetical protein DdX_16070 [Ditylenchus destructor]|uniref:Uncharacterized protein n=1 Tax=Ditylenchus destructor TaxID=166010 RepID=A0AAD4R0D4_9BILA|nr:hypothetical protein DdX_16070 [Ditylenchus destructor]